MVKTMTCERHHWREDDVAKHGRCPLCAFYAFRSELLYRLSREVAPSVLYAPSTFDGFDRAACRCGPASNLEPEGKREHGLVHCTTCDKMAAGAVQIAYLFERATYDTDGGWCGLPRCHLCDQPGVVMHPTRDEVVCISCGERIDRQALHAKRAAAKDRAESAAEKARFVAWRSALGDAAEPPGREQEAGELAAAIERAARLLARAGVALRGRR